MNKYNKYCDLDDVLANFDAAYFKLTGKDLKRMYISRAGMGMRNFGRANPDIFE